METFNNTTLFTGYLKQLLQDFNLPKYRIYTKAQQVYKEKYGVERYDVLETETEYYSESYGKIIYPKQLRYIPYIKDNRIQECIKGVWYDIGKKGNVKAEHSRTYTCGERILNYTKNLIIKTNSYDSYTHEYLGDYLRFIRDYKNINLMPLYNCFSNRQCDNLKIKITKKIKDTNKTIKMIFDSADKNYKIYMIPVKLFKEYTIAIDSDYPIELCCGLYGQHQDTRQKFATIAALTYRKVSKSCFSTPFLFSDLLNFKDVLDKNLLIELAQNEGDLKLFLKVPASNKSTIIILEGNYLT